MAVFSAEDSERLDYQLLLDGGVALYYQHEVLGEDVAWLALEKYELLQFDDGAMESLDSFHFEARLKFGAPETYEPTYEGFRGAASALEIPEVGGVALVFVGVDELAASDPISALRLFDVISDVSREFMLQGRRLVCLAQSDEPDLDLGPIGGKPLDWNPRERPAWTRGL